MNIKSLTPVLRTWNLRASITFYTEVLGFECESLSEFGQPLPATS